MMINMGSYTKLRDSVRTVLDIIIKYLQQHTNWHLFIYLAYGDVILARKLQCYCKI